MEEAGSLDMDWDKELEGVDMSKMVSNGTHPFIVRITTYEEFWVTTSTANEAMGKTEDATPDISKVEIRVEQTDVVDPDRPPISGSE